MSHILLAVGLKKYWGEPECLFLCKPHFLITFKPCIKNILCKFWWEHVYYIQTTHQLVFLMMIADSMTNTFYEQHQTATFKYCYKNELSYAIRLFDFHKCIKKKKPTFHNIFQKRLKNNKYFFLLAVLQFVSH